MRNIEQLNYGECKCINDFDSGHNQCMQRSYKMFSIESGNIINISMCNDYLRLLYKSINYNVYEDKISHILRAIYCELLNSDNNHKLCNEQIDEVSIYVSFRPSIQITINIIDAIKLLNKSIDVFDDEYKIFEYRSYLGSSIYNKISHIIERSLYYNKYKKYHEDARKLLNKMSKEKSYIYKYESDIIDLISGILSKSTISKK